MQPDVKRNVVHYFVSDISVFVSVYLSFLTMVWLTFELTGSSADLGIVGFVQNLPFFLFSVLGGVIADNVNRRKLVVRFNILFVVLSGTVAITYGLKLMTFPLILLFGFLLGSFYSIYYPSLIALVKDMVQDENEFPKVMGAAASNAKTGQLIASSSLSFLIATFTALGSFVSAFVFNLISFFSISRIKLKDPVIEKKQESVISQIKSGLGYVIQNKPLLLIIFISTIISLVFIFVTFQMPVIDKDFLAGGSNDLGILFIAGAIGGLTSGIYLGRRKSTKNLIWFLILCGVISSVSLVGLAYSRELVWSFIFAMGIDFAFIGAMGISNTLLQLLSTRDIGGRVLGVNTMMCWGLASLVMMLFGFLVDSIGIEFVMLLIAGIMLASVAMFYFMFKAERATLQNMYEARNIPEDSKPF